MFSWFLNWYWQTPYTIARSPGGTGHLECNHEWARTDVMLPAPQEDTPATWHQDQEEESQHTGSSPLTVPGQLIWSPISVLVLSQADGLLALDAAALELELTMPGWGEPRLPLRCFALFPCWSHQVQSDPTSLYLHLWITELLPWLPQFSCVLRASENKASTAQPP